MHSISAKLHHFTLEFTIFKSVSYLHPCYFLKAASAHPHGHVITIDNSVLSTLYASPRSRSSDEVRLKIYCRAIIGSWLVGQAKLVVMLYALYQTFYSQTSSIRCNESQHLNVYRLVMQVYLPNQSKPSVNSRMKM